MRDNIAGDFSMCEHGVKEVWDREGCPYCMEHDKKDAVSLCWKLLHRIENDLAVAECDPLSDPIVKEARSILFRM